MAMYKFKKGDYVISSKENVFRILGRHRKFDPDSKHKYSAMKWPYEVRKPCYVVQNLYSGACYPVKIAEAHGRWEKIDPKTVRAKLILYGVSSQLQV